MPVGTCESLTIELYADFEWSKLREVILEQVFSEISSGVHKRILSDNKNKIKVEIFQITEGAQQPVDKWKTKIFLSLAVTPEEMKRAEKSEANFIKRSPDAFEGI